MGDMDDFAAFAAFAKKHGIPNTGFERRRVASRKRLMRSAYHRHAVEGHSDRCVELAAEFLVMFDEDIA